MPGAVRASAGINTTDDDIARLLDAVARIASGDPPPMPYRQDRRTGDFHPCGTVPGLTGLAWRRPGRDQSAGAIPTPATP